LPFCCCLFVDDFRVMLHLSIEFEFHYVFRHRAFVISAADAAAEQLVISAADAKLLVISAAFRHFRWMISAADAATELKVISAGFHPFCLILSVADAA
jgi:hypothetical protein